MTHRIVDGLTWAAETGRPSGLPVTRPRGSKGAGLRYEKEISKALGREMIRGQWWEFRDKNGYGYCQTDLFREGDRFCLVLETKYTWCPEGHSQLELLYRPVVEFVTRKPMLGIQVCRALKPDMPGEIKIVNDLQSAIEVAKMGRLSVLHCFIPKTFQVFGMEQGQRLEQSRGDRP